VNKLLNLTYPSLRIARIYMTKEEEQEENILTKEIESWNSFEYALREEDRMLGRLSSLL
jgi:hypothetical protein